MPRSWPGAPSSPLVGCKVACYVSSFLICLIAMGHASDAAAQVRRAVIVGINKYAVDPRTDRTNDLEGAINDATAMVETLRTYHGFQAPDIHLLTDRQATRGQILTAIREHLIAPAQPGDISLFFFAGHGSYQDNPRSRELDQRDETIVPADTNRGAADIRDKELASLFNSVLDKKASLVALFDSCHSGSIAREVNLAERARFAPPRSGLPPSTAPGTAPGAGAEVLPEDRGAVILAAAQDQQPAQERYTRGQPRGRFSSALQQVLNTAAPGEAVEHLFLRLRARMQASGSSQEPALAATKERRQKTLWGTAVAEPAARPRVAIGRITSTVVYLQAGYSIGLGPKAVLGSVDKATPVKLQIVEVLGPAVSRATACSGDLKSVKPGDLFEVEQTGIPYLEPLRVLLPQDPPRRQELTALVKTLSGLRSSSRLVWVTDPTESRPTHTLLWHAGQWVLRDRELRELALGRRPTVQRAGRLLKARGPDVRLFVNLPLPAEELSAWTLGEEEAGKTIERSPRAAYADYALVGRMVDGRQEFAWVLAEPSHAARPAMPLRSEWISLDDSSLRDSLTDSALRLARVKTWLLLDTPPGPSPFPYHLQLQELQTKQFLDPGKPVRNGETYRLVLAAPAPVQRVQPRYVYLFGLDGNGGSRLLVPGPGMAIGENLVPDGRDRGPVPAVIPVGHGFSVSPPFGTDTLILLTSASALPDPSVLTMEPLHRGLPPRGPCSHPMECLIFGINEAATRSLPGPPVDWSIERLIVQSLEY